ncbi:MAG TPA: hypothetical protein VGQ99_01345 [Tepidisphaeraceae bacterium]|nr:hypothetical protein [Tepidisphaeraceae bacterium]
MFDLIWFCAAAFEGLKIEDFFNALTPVNMMPAFDSAQESQIFQQPAQIGKSDVGIGSATQNRVANLAN